nr:hypothetical protein [Tanacetum cinerariifolium]
MIVTCPKESIKRDTRSAITPLTRKNQVTFNDTYRTLTNNKQHEVQQKVHQSNVPVIPSTGVSSSTEASGSKPRRNTKKNKIPPAKSCSKHMTGNLSKLKNFIRKFIGIVRFKNDHFGAIMGYGDYVIGDSVISRVKFLTSKHETSEFITKFLKQIQVGFNKTIRYICTDNGTEFVNQVITELYERVSIFHQKSVPRTPQQNGVVKRRNRTLVEAAQTMLVFSKAPMFLWAEAVVIACYTQNRSLIHTRHTKTSYELVHNKKPDLSFLRVKGYRIHNKRTRQIIKTIHLQFDELNQMMALVQFSFGPEPILMTPRQLSSGLVPNQDPATPYVPPTDKELEILFQPMFDEFLEPTGDISSAESNQVHQPPNYLRKWSKDHPLDNIVGNPSRLVSTKKQLAFDAL